MKHLPFSAQLASMRSHVVELTEFCQSYESQGQTEPADAFEALTSSLDALRTAEEELRVQNEFLKSTQEALERQRTRYQELFEFAPTAYLVTDLRGMIREANRAACDLLQLDRRFPIHKPLANLVPEEGRPAFRSELLRLISSRGPREYEMRLRPRQGPPFPAVVTVVVQRDPFGEPTGLLWSLRDNSLVKLVEERLRTQNEALERRVRERTAQLEAELASKEQLLFQAHQALAAVTPSHRVSELLHGLPAIVWTRDVATGRFTFVNRWVETLLGHPPERWKNDPHYWFDHIPLDDREYVARMHARALDEGQPVEAEYRLIAANGRTVWFRESVRVVHDDQGRPVELRGLMVDISRRKKVERQFYYLKRELSNDLHDANLLLDLTSRLVTTMEMGPALQEILEAAVQILAADFGAVMLYRPECDDLVMTASIGFSEAFLAKVPSVTRGMGPCGRVLETGEPYLVEDVFEEPLYEPFRDLIGLEGFRATVSVPLKNSRGEFLGTLAALFREPYRPPERQMALLKRYANLASEVIENTQRYDTVRNADRRKDEFLATLSHELRNPLACLRAAVPLLSRPDVDDPTRSHAQQVVERQVAQLSRLVDDLLDVSRIVQGKIALHKATLDLAATVAEAVDAVRPAIEAHSHELTIDLPEEGLLLEADPTRLEQILVNLLHNAVKFTEPGGRIELSAHRDGSEAVIRVRDNGIGIAPEMIPELFTLFSQAHVMTLQTRDGLGIGLSLVRQLIHLHGGRVEVFSAGPGQGTEFVVRLPVGTLTPPNGRTDRERGRPDTTPPALRILLVEDHQDMARILARLLRSDGHQVEVVFNGLSALAVLRSEPPDVALLDLTLPDMDGYQLAERLRTQWPGIPLVALTGHASEDVRERSQAAGFDVHLVKPVASDALRTVLAQVARHRTPQPG